MRFGNVCLASPLVSKLGSAGQPAVLEHGRSPLPPRRCVSAPQIALGRSPGVSFWILNCASCSRGRGQQRHAGDNLKGRWRAAACSSEVSRELPQWVTAATVRGIRFVTTHLCSTSVIIHRNEDEDARFM